MSGKYAVLWKFQKEALSFAKESMGNDTEGTYSEQIRRRTIQNRVALMLQEMQCNKFFKNH